MTKRDLIELSDEFNALSGVFKALGPRLCEAGQTLEQGGRLPADDTIGDLQKARQRFLDLRDAVLLSAADEKLQSIPSSDTLATLGDLDGLIANVKEAHARRERIEKQRKVIAKAGSVLETVLKIAHRESSSFVPLQECHERARKLRESGSGDPEQLDLSDFEKLADGKHPFCDLIHLVEHRDDIDDQQWDELAQSVTNTFGKALATASVRGKLFIEGGNNNSKVEAAPAPEPIVPRHPRAQEMQRSPSRPPTMADDHTEMDFSIPDPYSTTEAVVPAPAGEEGESEADSLRRSMPEDPFRRSPLTVAQEQELFEQASGVSVLFGSRLAGLDDLEPFLELQDVRLITVDVATDRSGFLRELDALVQDRPDGMLFVVVPALCPWSEDWILRSLEIVKKKSSPKKLTRVLFIANPETTWAWVRMEDDVRAALRNDGLSQFFLRPWSNDALRVWLEETRLIECDPFIRERFTRVTGNWGELILQVGERLRDDKSPWQECLGDIETELTSRQEWEEALGLVAQAQTILKTMAQMTQPVSADDIAAKLSGGTRDRVDTVLRWADLLSYVGRASHYQWQLDPVVRQVVLK
ncbi:MAG: hypothetical protein AB7K24_23135 [Gemmataceae bacterium]